MHSVLTRELRNEMPVGWDESITVVWISALCPLFGGEGLMMVWRVRNQMVDTDL